MEVSRIEFLRNRHPMLLNKERDSVIPPTGLSVADTMRLVQHLTEPWAEKNESSMVWVIDLPVGHNLEAELEAHELTQP